MNWISGLFVHNPPAIFLLSGLFFAAYMVLRNAKPQAKSLLLPATLWAIWAIWEFCIVRFSPESDIRVDLLLIIPIVLIASLYGIIRLFISR